jgi:site-specific DNA-methyltransferase (adenine-specific)
MMELYKGDCLEVMKNIESGSVDAIITDPPYGTTACKWDSVIDFDLMWEQLNRIIKPNGAIVLFGSEPFSSALRMSNIKNYKYDWIWKKNRGSNFATLKYQPFKEHEIISVFNKHNYYPIKEERSESGKSRLGYKFKNKPSESTINGGKFISNGSDEYTNPLGKNLRNPSSVQKFNTEVGKHPTQKPVALMEYLIKTYTNENEAVLDFTMGSGTTGVACKRLNRNFIGIEQDDKYFEIAKNRIENAVFQIELF